MSKAHPQNGPSFSKAPPKKRSPMTDEELATYQGRQQAEREQTATDAAKARASGERPNWLLAADRKYEREAERIARWRQKLFQKVHRIRSRPSP
jgi:hypothetical protein